MNESQVWGVYSRHTTMDTTIKVRFSARIEDLARVVHKAWRDGMLDQGREVAEARLEWETLSDEDKALDHYIAEQIVDAVLDRIHNS